MDQIRKAARRIAGIGIAALLGAAGVAEAAAATSPPPSDPPDPSDPSKDGPVVVATDAEAGSFRVATFNASLNRETEGELLADLSTPENEQAATIAQILQITRPDIVLINEFDYDEGHESLDLFRDNYLAVGQDGNEPLDYPYAFTAPSNTGIDSGFDLNNDGELGGPDDAFGFGLFPGQYGMAVYSRYPILLDDVRTFQLLPWTAMPDARLPSDPDTDTEGDWYSPEALEVFRLSSKSHWDVPIDVEGRVVHLLASHPTPPAFDGPERRNKLRNADEIRFWAEYVAGDNIDWIVDDAGRVGGLAEGAEFVIAGDLNSDPDDGDSEPGAAQQVLDLDVVTDPLPVSEGAVEAAEAQGGANDDHVGDPRFDTADFADDAPGNLRVDYVLPSAGFTIVDAGVFWPTADDPLSALTGEFPFPSSDHRLVWVDLS